MHPSAHLMPALGCLTGTSDLTVQVQIDDFYHPLPHLIWSFRFAYFSEWYHYPSYYTNQKLGIILDTSDSLPIFYP